MANFQPGMLLPIVLLTCSNLFMTFAWYGHLKFTSRPLWMVVMVSWGIAFFEYWLAVPANRWGIRYYNPAELKTIQEVIAFAVFTAFSIFYLGQTVSWQQIGGFALIIAGAAVVFSG